MTPIPRFNLYQNVPRKFMPVLWFEQHVVASKSIANIVKLILALPVAGQILGVIFVIIGLTLVFTAWSHKRDGYQMTAVDNTKTESQTANLPETLPMLKN